MHSQVVAFTLALLLTACTTPPLSESSYSRGVAAYRAKDYATARAFWSTAAAGGDLSAQSNLGYLLYYGLGGTPDQQRAVSLWRRAAELGHSEAQRHLGFAYEEGNAVPKSIVEAYAWYRCAISSTEAATKDDPSAEKEIGDDARKALAKLLGRLSPAEFVAGQELATRYITEYARK